MNEKFLKEAREIEARWSKSGLLESLKDRCSTAVLLDSQRLINEQKEDDLDPILFTLETTNDCLAQIVLDQWLLDSSDRVQSYLEASSGAEQ